MAKYRKKPVVVEAIQWTGKNTSAIQRFCPEMKKIYDGRKLAYLLISARGNGCQAIKNYWIVRQTKGFFCSYHPDIFEQTYEKVEG